MDNNIFTFDNSYWLQLSGMAMGTPAACAHATVTLRQYENSQILPLCKPNLMHYKQYIDDIFGIRILQKLNLTTHRLCFKQLG
jgi:hypothetical protein